MKKDILLKVVYFFTNLTIGLTLTLGASTLIFLTFFPNYPEKIKVIIESSLCLAVWISLAISIYGSIWLIYQHCKTKGGRDEKK
jgi:hypothetical protein